MSHGSDGPDTPDRKEVVADHSEELKSDWQRALSDMQAMAEDREEQGYETLAIPAGDTTTLSPDMGDDDRWGLAHIVPNNYADDFEALYDESSFDETAVYQLESGGFAFLVTELIDHDAEVVVFIAASYDLRFAAGLVRTAMERDEMYTHVRTLDHTNLGTVHHDDPEAFFPDPEAIYAYDVTE
ncbi:DUF7529 family protein [Halosimplex salinum]|uniref:DUF7529 family protein n=1 Tax=Halosimplex salinum TaxID=1710538 RepID=UPI000F466147|nr:hypothetical protein [Halosimplex salinum]